MALTYSNIEMYAIGNRRMHRCDLAFDNSYPLDGETFNPERLRMRDIDMALISPRNGYLFEYDYANSKIKVMNPTAEVIDSLVAEVESGGITVKSSGESGSIISLSGDAGIAGYAGTEVEQGTDLSLLTGVRAIFIGY
jgi:hypothetical protein